MRRTNTASSEQRSALFLKAGAGLLAMLMSACGGGGGGETAAPAPSATANRADLGEGVVSVPVRFTVENRNRSLSLCPVDGRSYQIRGRLVGPAGAFSSGGADAVTVYMHGVGWGQFYWHFRDFPDVDYASHMARLGHVSLVYDQLGYGDSGRPSGLLNCYGGEADIVHQMIDDLRSGDYVMDSGARRFSRVALASHQAAGLMAQPAAYSFRNIDALIVTAFSDFGPAFKPAIVAAFSVFSTSCLAGGERSDGGSGPFFYEFFPKLDDRFGSLSFANAEGPVIARATQLRRRAACGELNSALPTVGADNLQILLRQIRVPVLLVNGLEDGFFIQPLGANAQRALYGGSSDVSSELIAGAGQALALERSAPEFRRVMHDWLSPRGF